MLGLIGLVFGRFLPPIVTQLSFIGVIRNTEDHCNQFVHLGEGHGKLLEVKFELLLFD